MGFKGNNLSAHHRNENSATDFKNANGGILGDSRITLNYLLKNTFVDGKFYHTLQNGIPKIDGFLEDYAYMAGAALVLY